MVRKIPENFHTLTPSLNINGASKAIELYKKAFNAKELYRTEYPGGLQKIMHACIEIGDSKLFLADTNPEMGSATPSFSSFYVYVDDVDATFRQAKKVGLNETFPVQDMFWGDRMGNLQDSFGNSWSIATHVRDVSPEEMEEGKKNFGKKAA